MIDKNYIKQYRILLAIKKGENPPHERYFVEATDKERIELLSLFIKDMKSDNPTTIKELLYIVGLEDTLSELVDKMLHIKQLKEPDNIWGEFLDIVDNMADGDCKNSLAIFILDNAIRINGINGYETIIEKIVDMVDKADDIIRLAF